MADQLRFAFGHELIVDLFAGGGGASEGIRQAFGRDPDICINHDPVAVSMHAANHPGAKHYVSDVFEVDPVVATGGRPVGLLWASPDCFPAGTLVLTRQGYTPIEEIQVGDEVMTHKARWRKVTETSTARRPLISIRGHGHPGIAVSPEHPFYARHRKDVWQTDPRGYRRALDPADWMPASALEKGWYWSTLTAYPDAIAPPVPGRGMEVDEDFLWLAGRYLGDGWTRLTDTRAEVVITCGKHEVDRLRAQLDQWPRSGARAEFNELQWHERSTGTAYQFAANHRGLVEWLREHFGHRAESKRIPAWALGIAPELRHALLAGYLSADGWDNNTFSECRTVSKALAFGIKALLNTIGKTVTVHRLQNTSVIEGRQVSAREIYMLRWRAQVDDKHAQTFLEDGMEWTPIREQEDLAVDAEVFNIGVEEDESYLAEGIVVHNCKHFSKAKGGKPRSKKIRSLAWVVVKWARSVAPRVIILENVEEFVTWGPLGRDGQPCVKRKGQTFERWVAQLRACGYAVQWRELRACDFGAPTIRKRFFLIARRDKLPIRWPAPTHGKPDSLEVRKGKLLPWRTAAECIDWALPCPSIFLTPAEARAIGVKRPLADATMRRIAKGVDRFVLQAARPFIVPVTHTGSDRVNDIDEPLRTVTCATRGEHALVAPTLVDVAHGEVGTNGSVRWSSGAHSVETPSKTVTASGNQALVSAFLTKYRADNAGADAEAPFPTITANGESDRPGGNPPLAIVAAHLDQANAGGYDGPGRSAEDPLSTATATGAQQRVVASTLVKLRGTSNSADVTDPLHTVSAQGFHHAEVRAFLIKFYGQGGQHSELADPMHTVPTRDRMGLVTVDGTDYEIADIGLRMLTPRELFRAQGFPESYEITTGADGRRFTKDQQVRCCGNSVCPPIARALVAANAAEVIEMERREAA